MASGIYGTQARTHTRTDHKVSYDSPQMDLAAFWLIVMAFTCMLLVGLHMAFVKTDKCTLIAQKKTDVSVNVCTHFIQKHSGGHAPPFIYLTE